jgi:hypothetical protein
MPRQRLEFTQFLEIVMEHELKNCPKCPCTITHSCISRDKVKAPNLLCRPFPSAYSLTDSQDLGYVVYNTLGVGRYQGLETVHNVNNE